jgi:ATP-dependent Clp protease ATP-binding subunit ClpC
MFERFTDRARLVVVLAQEEARMLNHNYIGTEHMLLGLIHEGEGVAAKALESLGISLEAVRQQVEEIIGRGQQAPSGHIPFTPRAKKVLELSLRESLQLGHNYIGTEHILLGLIREGDGVAAQALVRLGGDLNRVRQQVVQLLHGYQVAQETSPGSTPVPASSPTPPLALGQIGRNLTGLARAGELDPVIGREREIERVTQVLSRRALGNPMLVGAPGAGKTAVAAGLAQRMASGQAQGEALAGKLLYGVDLGMLAGRSADQDDLGALLLAALEEVRVRGDVLLFLDGLGALTIDSWLILLPLLGNGGLQFIGALTADEYRALLDAHPALARTFVPVTVNEPTVAETVAILTGLRDRYEDHHQVSITDTALVAAAELASRQLPGRQLPGKAVELIDEAAALCRTRRVAEVDESMVAESLAIMLGLASGGTGPGQQPPAPDVPRFAPASMTDDDREIWSMA